MFSASPLPPIAFADYFALLRYATIRHFITSPRSTRFRFRFSRRRYFRTIHDYFDAAD
jgi:hypothetical protein